MFNSIAFDVDGTLVNTQKIMVSCLRSAIAEECGKDYSEHDLIFAFGIPLSFAVDRLCPDRREAVIGRFHERWKQEAEHAVLFPGIPELFNELKKRKIKTGVVTSRRRFEMEADNHLLKIIPYIDFIISSDDTEKHKPEAEPLLKYFELSESEPGDCIYIGDTVYDYQCAKNAGAEFGFALWGQPPTEGVETDFLLKDPLDLLQFV